jgi:hypothetical protein
MGNQRDKLDKFFKGADIVPGAFVNLTIANVASEELGLKKELKDVVYFRETPKGLVMNKGHRTTLIMLFGDFDEQWVGKRVTLYSCDTRSPTGISRGLRILEKGQAVSKGLPTEAEAFMFGV